MLILLIVAALKPTMLQDLHDIATDAGLDVLVEVHDLLEIQIALEAGASIIGVNNRNLRTLVVDTEVSHQAIESIPDDAIAVAESGLKTGDDLRRLRGGGIRRLPGGRAPHDDQRSRSRPEQPAERRPGMNLFVKVCGITRVQDAELASRLGAAAVGFVFWPGSPRYIAPDAARSSPKWCRQTS